jgi:hypothetical protein
MATRGISIAVTMASISPLLLVVLREALDQLALGEVVSIGPVDLVPLVGSLLCWGQLLGAPTCFFLVGGLLRPSVARAAIDFRLFFLLPSLLRSGEAGSSSALRRSVWL